MLIHIWVCSRRIWQMWALRQYVSASAYLQNVSLSARVPREMSTYNVHRQVAPSNRACNYACLILTKFMREFSLQVCTSQANFWPCNTQRDLKHFTRIKASDGCFRGVFWGDFPGELLSSRCCWNYFCIRCIFGAKCPTRSVCKPQKREFHGEFLQSPSDEAIFLSVPENPIPSLKSWLSENVS